MKANHSPSREYLLGKIKYGPLSGRFIRKPKKVVGKWDTRTNIRWVGKPIGDLDGGYLWISLDDIKYPASKVAWVI